MVDVVPAIFAPVLASRVCCVCCHPFNNDIRPFCPRVQVPSPENWEPSISWRCFCSTATSSPVRCLITRSGFARLTCRIGKRLPLLPTHDPSVCLRSEVNGLQLLVWPARRWTRPQHTTLLCRRASFGDECLDTCARRWCRPDTEGAWGATGA